MKIELSFIGHAGLGEETPVYKDQKGNMWGDVNSKEEDKPEFRKFDQFMDDYDDWQEQLSHNPLITDFYGNGYKTVEVAVVSDYERDPQLRFNYMLLSRLQSDCNYFLGWGNGHENLLPKDGVDGLIDEMVELHNSFPEHKKPEWLSLEKIEDYRSKMKEITDEKTAIREAVAAILDERRDKGEQIDEWPSLKEVDDWRRARGWDEEVEYWPSLSDLAECTEDSIVVPGHPEGVSVAYALAQVAAEGRKSSEYTPPWHRIRVSPERCPNPAIELPEPSWGIEVYEPVKTAKRPCPGQGEAGMSVTRAAEQVRAASKERTEQAPPVPDGKVR